MIYLYFNTNVQFKKTIEKIIFKEIGLQLKTKTLLIKIYDSKKIKYMIIILDLAIVCYVCSRCRMEFLLLLPGICK